MYSSLNADYPSLAASPAVTCTAARFDELKADVASSYREFLAATGSVKTAKAEVETAHRVFADRCFALWENRAQGDKSGKGFSRALKDAGVNRGRAYRAMWHYDLVPRRTKSPKVKVPRLNLKTLLPMVGDPTAFSAELTGLLQAALGVAFVVEVRLP